jgi:hypothetical protein
LFWSFWEGHQDSNTEDEYDDSTIGGGHYAIGNARGVTKYLAAWSDNWSGLAAPAGQEAADLVATASQYGSMIWDDEPTFPPFVPLNEWDNGGFTYDSAPYWWPLDYAPPDGWVSASYVSVNASRDETVQGVYYNSNGDPVDVSIPQIFYNQVRLKVNGIHPYGDTRRFLVVKENKGRDESSPEFTTENKVIGVATLSIPAGTNLCNATFTPAGSEGTPDVQVSTFGDGSKGLTVEPLIAADYTSYDYKSAAVTFKPIEININDTSDTKDDVVRRRPKGRRQKASPMGSLHRARTR